jgi:class 3 adenylate cyclase/pimeloyl-ACP methyl ester carboxylesterase
MLTARMFVRRSSETSAGPLKELVGGPTSTAPMHHHDPVREIPPVRYLRHPAGAIAYQVWGQGELDLLLMTGFTTSVDNIWEHPGRLRFLSSYGELGRVIRFDPRGQGASDPLPLDEVGQLGPCLDDALHVLDTLDVAEAVVCAELDAGQVGLRLAAEHSERVIRLALLNPFARRAVAEDYPIGEGAEGDATAWGEWVSANWGTGELTAGAVPALATGAPDPRFLGRTERLGASPAVAGALFAAAYRADVRAVLPSIGVPTLVVHTGDVPLVPVELSRYVADHIPGAQFLEVPSRSFYWGEFGISAYAEFLSGHVSEHRERVISSVLFTDVVDSTRVAAELGDARWEQLLTHLDEFVAIEVARLGGRLIKRTGDGHLVTFPTPGAAIEASRAILQSAPTLHVEVRAGIHTGEIEERSDGDVAGIAVHVAARVASLASAHQLLVSRTVADLVSGGGFLFEDHGSHELKGLPGTWALYAVNLR